MQSPVLERLVGGAVLAGLLLLLALAIDPRDRAGLPDVEGSESPVAHVAFQPAEPGIAAVPNPGRAAPGEAAAEGWIDQDSLPADATRGTAPPAGNELGAEAQAPGAGAAMAGPAAPAAPQWGVQVGSFAERGNAAQLSDWCREQGYGVKIVAATQESGALYRVWVGPFATRGEARSAVAQLALRGRNSFVTDWDEGAP